ncbi:MAG: hypothetical protein M1275_00295 [Patescibacteria group bacterium]|nr:hypothetical protein [Patescibacteria group bacterium]
MTTEDKEFVDVLQDDAAVYCPAKTVAEAYWLKDYEKVYREALADPEGFWEEAAEELVWSKRWTKVYDESRKPFYSWFVGGKTNLFINALERHQKTPTAKKVAYHWEGELPI